MSLPGLERNRVEAVGMAFDRVDIHRQRILRALSKEVETTIPVEKACTVAEGGILAWELVQRLVNKGNPQESALWRKNHLLTCVPAAGAASRYLKDLHKFTLELEAALPGLVEGKHTSNSGWKEALGAFPISDKLAALSGWVVHQGFDKVKETRAKFISLVSADGEKKLEVYATAKAILSTYDGTAKASVETTLEGETFLEVKLLEQLFLLEGAHNALIVPAGMTADFQKELKASAAKLSRQCDVSAEQVTGKWSVFEQGKNLSTLRFLKDGSPLIDEKGSYSAVSAGHGELVHLFDEFVSKWPSLQALHIRNIDNVIGTEEERSQELLALSESFRMIRDALEDVRAVAKNSESQELEFRGVKAVEAIRFLGQLVGKPLNDIGIERENTVQFSTVVNILGSLFGWSHISDIKNWRSLNEHLQLPLSVLGVVKKEEADVGGGPVFARLKDGSVVKLCMEMPHANQSDAAKFFEAGGQSTHFNPVLVFVEMRTNTEGNKEGSPVNFGQLFDERFWLLSNREYQGKSVCYHETVLYELLGNSARTNLVFVEVPRTLFNPHKSIFDSLGKDRSSYGLGKVFKS